jgi:hypothetical protein
VVALAQRPFEGGREDVPVEDARVRVVQDGGLDTPAHQRLGLPHEELVEGVLARHEHGQARAAPAGAPPLLAQARDRPREAHRDGAVEQADVDPELERVRGGDAEELSLDEPALDVAPLGRRVARPVGGEARSRLRIEAVGGEAVDQLSCLAALREADRPQPAGHELGQEAGALPERAGTKLQRLVEYRRVPERDRARRPRGAVVGDDPCLDPEERAGELARVGDRRRGEQELRLRAVDTRQPPQPSQHVADV